MATSKSLSKNMRMWHRYLGFFLAGIMAVYALSGIVMVFRTTDFLKKDYQYTKELEPNLTAEELAPALEMRVRIEGEDGNIITFNGEGTYNTETGVANYSVERLPLLLDKMTKMHKATVNSPLFYLNIFFGVSLLFFVISSFWMFMPSSKIFRKSMYFTVAGIALVFLMLAF